MRELVARIRSGVANVRYPFSRPGDAVAMCEYLHRHDGGLLRGHQRRRSERGAVFDVYRQTDTELAEIVEESSRFSGQAATI
jgi:hypothetical protein